jgi:hypothetical protein
LLLTVTLSACSTYSPTNTTKSTDSASATQPIDRQTSYKAITTEEINLAQEAWGNGIINIGKAYSNGGDYRQAAIDLINNLYAYNYEDGVVLFKPTKASIKVFRSTKESALSYFVGNNKKHTEDGGFALEPWVSVVFDNHQIYRHGDIAIAMGEYTFTDPKGGSATAQYTFGYTQTTSGQLKIFLHHSSLPYDG